MTEHIPSEEEPLPLEEKIRSLQQQGLPPEKVVEKILEEDLNANISVLADVLQLDKLVIGRIKGRLSRIKKSRALKAERLKPHEEGKGEEPPSPYKGETDVNAILDDILQGHPDISQKIHDEVMDWAKLKGLLQPMELQAILLSMRGISSQTANIIASKYSFAVVKAQQEGKLTLPPPVAGILQPSTQIPWGFGSAGGPSSPFPSPTTTIQPGFPTGSIPSSTPQTQTQVPYWPPDIRGMIREELERVERSKPKEPEDYVDIEEPVRDSEGKYVIGPDDKPVVKRMHMPASQAAQLAPKEDAEMRVLEKLEKYKKIFGSEITEEKIRQIIKEATPAPAVTEEKPVTLEDVKKASAEAAQTTIEKVLEAHEKEDVEDKRHRETLAAIERSGSARTVEGYKEDSFRILGQGLSEVAAVAKEKKPGELAVRILGGEVASPKKIEAGAGESILERLQKRGLVVEE